MRCRQKARKSGPKAGPPKQAGEGRRTDGGSEVGGREQKSEGKAFRSLRSDLRGKD